MVKDISATTKIIIALGHSGIDRDKEIAKAIPELDIVIGGHSHTLLYNGEILSIKTIPYLSKTS